ncbi:NosD domain-containing protein [Microbulbifer sp. SSSA005]|uniref:NosD domain-containing protein n=1 Tax=Microbulbifer sp. SSSA005 TaxID=3243378 RepID=UPI00403A524D
MKILGQWLNDGIAILLTAIIAVAPIATKAVDCGDTVTLAEVLDQNLNCATNPAVTIVGPGSLDMNGFSVSCGGSGVGIRIEGIAASVTGGALQDGVITNCGAGMVVLGEFHSIFGVNITDNMNLGLVIPGDNNSLLHSVIMSNANVGVVVIGSNNTISSNEIGQNESEGIRLEGIANGSVVLLNHIYSSSFSGIVVNSSDNLIAQNFIEHNGPGGAGIDMPALGQSGNTIVGNLAENNLDYDLQDLNSAPCLNTWVGNMFDTSNGACVDP